MEALQNSGGKFSLTSQQCSWIASAHELGRMIGPLLVSVFLDKVGRKVMLVFCTLVNFLIWPFILFTKSFEVICAIRLVFGIAVGVWDVCACIYLAENSNSSLRGIYGSISVGCFYGGELIEFALAAYFPYGTVATIDAVVTLLALSCILVTVESPQFLITKDRYEQAAKNFSWLRGKPLEEVAEEFDKLKIVIRQESAKKLTIRDLFRIPLYYKTVLMVLALCVLTMSTGYSAVTSFVSIAFSESEFLTSNQFTILFGLLQFASISVSPFIIENLNRKTIMLSSLTLVALSHACTALLYYVNDNVTPVPYFPWLIFASIAFYAMVFSSGMYPIYYIIRGELFPQNVKPIGGCIAIMGNSMMGFFTSSIFLTISERYGIHANFLLYSAFSVVTIIYVHFVIPETRGKTLAQIQESIMSSLEDELNSSAELEDGIAKYKNYGAT